MKTVTDKVIEKSSWRIAWSTTAFRKKMILGIICLIVLFGLFPWFFENIERRNGVLIQDWLLEFIPAYDVSIPIFVILYSIGILGVIRIYQNPSIGMMGVWGFVFLFFSRMITIALVSLNPPNDMVALVDPLSVIFYGSKTITKDLFFSGHTASVLLSALCFENKRDKVIGFISAFIIGLLLLVQHAHYTIDVLGAVIFSFLAWYLAKKIARN